MRTPIHCPAKLDLENMYLIDGKSTYTIAKEYGFSQSFIVKCLHDYNITMRKQGPPPKKRYCGARNDPTPPPYRPPPHKTVCTILKDHAESLKDDPERLSTEFLQRLIGVKC